MRNIGRCGSGSGSNFCSDGAKTLATRSLVLAWKAKGEMHTVRVGPLRVLAGACPSVVSDHPLEALLAKEYIGRKC